MPSKKLKKEIAKKVRDYAAKWRSLVKNFLDALTSGSNMGLPGGSMQVSGILGTITSFQSLYEIYLGACDPDEEEDDTETEDEALTMKKRQTVLARQVSKKHKGVLDQNNAV